MCAGLAQPLLGRDVAVPLIGDEREFKIVDEALGALPQAPVTASVCQAALGAMRELGARRRLPAIDYLIAAAAAERGFGVVHADKHFELLVTVLEFESVRVADGAG